MEYYTDVRSNKAVEFYQSRGPVNRTYRFILGAPVPYSGSRLVAACLPVYGLQTLIRIRQSLTINRPVAEVFRFMTEAGNIFKWSRATEEVRQLTEDAIGVGARYLIVSKFLGSHIPLEVEVTEYELNKRVGSRAISSSFVVHGRTLYEQDGANTIVISESEIHPRGVWKLLQPLLPRMIAKSSAQDFERLRKALEESIVLDVQNPPKVINVTQPVVTVEQEP